MRNLALEFEPLPPEPEHSLDRPAPVQALAAHFEQAMQQDGSPVRAVRHQRAKPACFGDFPAELNPILRSALASRGIENLYSHQAEAVEHALARRNVIVVTPTASGKTLCYNLPVAHSILANNAAHAIFLFPTKALAEDQRLELQGLNDAIDKPFACHTYDGDTPQDARRAIRDKANVILTNPDMLHAGILPHHTKWVKLFENLRYIVIDELHYYRGVYGSHLANVLRRLKRICEFYGSHPQFVCCSATIANPRQLAEAVTGQPFELVAESGAPAGEHYFIFYNPPVVNRQLGIRRSYLHETRRIALEFVRQKQQTLVFTNNRLATEILTTYLKDACSQLPFSNEAVRGYRGGYLPKERRSVERDLRSGDIRAVIATNALELGMDIGSLDTVVMAGYPGTIASTWQRAGRAGRRASSSIAVLIASSAPLDQYIVEHPDYFFGTSPEEAHINADNLEILLSHLKCAAFELPLKSGEMFGTHDVAKFCSFLAEDLRLLHRSGDLWHWVSDSYPADSVSLRAVTSDNFLVVDITGDHRVIGEVDFPPALTTLHEKAIYLHDARQYQVERLDFDGRRAFVRQVDSDYFTDAIVYTQVSQLTSFESAPAAQDPHAQAILAEVRVKRQVVGFKKIKFYTLENLGAGNLSLPEQEMHTTAFYLHFSSAFFDDLKAFSTADLQDAIRGLGNVLQTVAAVLLLSDPRDLGLAVLDDSSEKGTVFERDIVLYDNYPGGIGQSDPLFRRRAELLQAALELAEGCACEAGCPSCVGPHNEIGPRGREGAIRILRKLL
ncbi:MAG: DEAD/DEAH box helicase [Acidobacteriaceae bacterium]|nr:DEAD/DEAH box helicase [Acidobacteriaceae bacterium]MBV9499588.1 DEAD/DEAH box helicase [Acidobacteriaceae bacterium]